jgi:hypothetical protein
MIFSQTSLPFRITHESQAKQDKLLFMLFQNKYCIYSILVEYAHFWEPVTKISLAGKSLYREKEMVPQVQLSNNCGLRCRTIILNILSLLHLTIVQLIDRCTCGTIPFPLYRDFPDWSLTEHCWQMTQTRISCKSTNSAIFSTDLGCWCWQICLWCMEIFFTSWLLF